MIGKHRHQNSPPYAVDLGGIQGAISQQVDLWCKAQTAFLSAWQAAANGWFKHRQEGVAAARDTFRGMCSCKDLSEMATLQQKWMVGAVDRLSADAQAMTDTAISTSHKGAELLADNGLAVSCFTETPLWKTGRVQKSPGSIASVHRVTEKSTPAEAD